MITTCPCCKQAISRPTMEVVSAVAGLSRLEHRVLDAIWKGKGLPVPLERIISAVWWDFIDGGPDDAEGNIRVLIYHVRRKLATSGIRIKSGGPNRGYSLELVQDRSEEDGGIIEQGAADRTPGRGPGAEKPSEREPRRKHAAGNL